MKYLSLFVLLFSTPVQSAVIIPNVIHALEVASERYNLPLPVLKALSWVESRHDPKAINKYDGGSASYGLCQLKIKTARAFGYHGNIRGLFDAYVNADLGAKYLSYQFKRYDRNWIKAISAYSRGNANAINSDYVNKVFKEIVK